MITKNATAATNDPKIALEVLRHNLAESLDRAHASEDPYAEVQLAAQYRAVLKEIKDLECSGADQTGKPASAAPEGAAKARWAARVHAANVGGATG